MEQSNLLHRLTEDESQRTAFYNTIFFLLLTVFFGGLYVVYNMMWMFLTPLLFGTLVGTVLFPLKRSFSSRLNDWLDKLDEENRPFLVGVLLLPVQCLNRTASSIFNGVYSAKGIYCIAGYILLKVLAYERTLITILSSFGRIYNTFDLILEFLVQFWILPVISLYAVGYFSWIFIQSDQELHERKKFARTLSLPIWIIALAFASSFCGPLHVFVFALSGVLLVLIAAGVIRNYEEEETPNIEKDPVETTGKKPEASSESLETSVKSIKSIKSITSDRIMRITAFCFALLWTAKHDLILVILLALLAYGFILDVFERIQLWKTATSFIHQALPVKEQCEKITNIVVPGFLRQFVYILFTSDRYLIGGLKQKVDLIASISVMIFLLLGAIFFGLFTVFQLQSETIHIGTLAGNVVSSNPEWLKAVTNYTGEKFNERVINDYAEQAYKQSREWVAHNIRSLADSKDKDRADQLEEQAKLLVDNLYHLYEERIKSLPDNTSSVAIRGDWFAQLVSTTNVESLKGEITQIVKENIETVLSIAQSLWKVLVANISIFSTVLFSIAGFLFGFGFDLLNFLIETLVFVMVAYYLLANSSNCFLPIQWIKDIAPSIQSRKSQIKIAEAVESSISSVFVLSAKMSIFYFLHTYFIHSLFGLTIVFIPSLLASILAAVPIAPAYSVSIFGIVELYLVRSESAPALIFFIANVAPIFFADAAFYSEIKQCHPYLVGLAVVGGIYRMGMQGAIIGPIVLCILVVLFNVYAEFVKR